MLSFFWHRRCCQRRASISSNQHCPNTQIAHLLREDSVVEAVSSYEQAEQTSKTDDDLSQDVKMTSFGFNDAFETSSSQDDECATSTHVTADTIARSWYVGDAVERLLDDVSDIWTGAEIVAVHLGGMYDIAYADDGSVERHVESWELRARKSRLDFPAEVWEYVGDCLCFKEDLCTFGQIAKATFSAMQQKQEVWWCTAFHERFGRCSGRCEFEKILSAEAQLFAVASIRKCFNASCRQLTKLDKLGWMARYIEQERLTDPERTVTNSSSNLTVGDIAYSVSGKKTSSAHVPLKGWFFDPRLGRMVREC